MSRPPPKPFTSHPTPYTLHPSPHTLHPTPFTSHPTPFTSHPSPYTLHFTRYTLHATQPPEGCVESAGGVVSRPPAGGLITCWAGGVPCPPPPTLVSALVSGCAGKGSNVTCRSKGQGTLTG